MSNEPNEPPLDPRGGLQTWASPRKCPACDIDLFAARRSGYRIDACGRCGGVWLPNADAKRMLERASEVPAELADMATNAAPAATITPKGRPCPDCKKPLERVVVARVDVDACKVHGTWFDAHELRSVSNVLVRPRQFQPAGVTYDYAPAAEAAFARQEAATDVVLGVAVLAFELLGSSDD